MSNRRKKRVRSRMDATGEKYTTAGRHLEQRESVTPDPLQGGVLGDLFRRACDGCGSAEIRWTDPAQMVNIDREAYFGAKTMFGAEALLAGTAWVCTNCSQVGFSPSGGHGLLVDWGDWDDDDLDDE